MLENIFENIARKKNEIFENRKISKFSIFTIFGFEYFIFKKMFFEFFLSDCVADPSTHFSGTGTIKLALHGPRRTKKTYESTQRVRNCGGVHIGGVFLRVVGKELGILKIFRNFLPDRFCVWCPENTFPGSLRSLSR